MSEGITPLSTHAPLSTEKVANRSDGFNTKDAFQNRGFEKHAFPDQSSDLTKSQIDHTVQDPTTTAPSGAAHTLEGLAHSDKTFHTKVQQHLLSQLSMLGIPGAHVADPENVAAFETAFQTLFNDSDLCMQLTNPSFEKPIKKISTSSNAQHIQLPSELSVEQQALLRERLADPTVRAALKLVSMQPDKGCLESLALEMAVKTINLTSSSSVQATKDSEKILDVQKDSNAEGLKNFKEKLDKSRTEMQKAMKSPIKRWFSAIFKGIGGIIAAVCTGDISIAMKSISSAHDDATKAQYDPKKGNDYNTILRKLGHSPFQAKWFKVLSTVLGIASMAAMAVFALPKMIVSSGKMLTKFGGKKLAKLFGKKDGITRLTRGGNKLGKLGEKLAESSEKLFQSTKQGVKKMLSPKQAELGKGLNVETTALESEALATAEGLTKAETLTPATQTAEAARQEWRYYSPLNSLIKHSKRPYQLTGTYQTRGNLIRGGVTILDQSENYVEKRADANANFQKQIASLDLQTQRSRYQRMSASLSDLNSRLKQEQASTMSQAINAGAQMMKELSEKRLRMVTRRL